MYNVYSFVCLPLSSLFFKFLHLNYLLNCSQTSNVVYCDFQTVKLQDAHVVIENCPMAVNCAGEVTASTAIVTTQLVGSSANVNRRT